MATINLGSIKFNWQGAYNGATAYAVDDVVSSGGSSYICIAATTGNAPPNATYWEQMSSAGTDGTDGTDLGTTLTTQGDIVYRDASGLARLGAGTSGQVLQTNGTGANPSWGTVSSDFVKIADANVTSGSKVSFNNVFTTGTYNSYKAIISSYKPATAGWLKFYFRNGGVDVTSSYYWITDGVYASSSSSSSTIYKGSWPDSFIPITYWGSDPGGNCIAEIHLGNPAESGTFKTVNITASLHTPAGEQFQNDSSGINSATATYDGFSIETTSSFSIMKVQLYGLK